MFVLQSQIFRAAFLERCKKLIFEFCLLEHALDTQTLIPTEIFVQAE